MYEKNVGTVTTRTRKGNLAIQQNLTEKFSNMGMQDIQSFLKTRKLSISGYSEFTDPKSGETTLCIGIETYGKATFDENIGNMLKGNIRWDHLILDGQRVF